MEREIDSFGFAKAFFVVELLVAFHPSLSLLLFKRFFLLDVSVPMQTHILRRGCEIGAGGKGRAFVGGRSDSKPMKMLSHVRNAAALL